MKITCVMVESVDGKTTKGDVGRTFLWTSVEDQQHFKKLVEENNLIIMGRKTYEVSKNHMEHKKGRLRVIITNNPEKYKSEEIKGILEFSDENPRNLINHLEKQGYLKALLTGGARLNSLFFRENLVNELWLTIEPKIFGIGNSIVGEEMFDLSLELLSVAKLNEKGTLLLQYSVVKK